MKVVINKCYGGFDLSIDAMKLLIENKSAVVQHSPAEEWLRHYDTFDAGDGYTGHGSPGLWFGLEKDDLVFYVDREDKHRNDPALVNVVEQLGDAASGDLAELKIIEIPDDIEFEIQEYDGIEWIAEKHRTWG